MKRRESQQATGRGLEEIKRIVQSTHYKTYAHSPSMKGLEGINTAVTAAHPINKHTLPSRKTLIILPILQRGKISPGEVVSFTRLPI